MGVGASPIQVSSLPLGHFRYHVTTLAFNTRLASNCILNIVNCTVVRLAPTVRLAPFVTKVVNNSTLLNLFLNDLILK